jgi:hypothetical protein
LRNHCACAPFSTRGPSGLSLAAYFESMAFCSIQKLPAGAADVPSSVVQKLMPESFTKPVVFSTAAVLVLSARNRSLFTNANWYCLRLPIQRGKASALGRNIPMNTWFR